MPQNAHETQTSTRTQPLADNVVELLWFGDDDPAHSRHEASLSMAAAVAEIQGLKPFPAVAQRVMQLAAVDDPDLHEVAHAISGDPSLATRTLRLASSAAFGVGKPLLSVHDALLRLGLQRVTQMVTAMSVMGMFVDTSAHGKFLRDHCVGVASLGQTLARQTSFAGHDQVFLCGLLHDVGRLLLLQTGETSTVDASEEELPVLERSELGYDHAVLGGHVLAAWGLSDVLSQVVAWHHQPVRAYQAAGDVGVLVGFVRVADALDEQIATLGQLSPEFLDALATAAECCYLDISGSQLKRHAEALVAVRAEALSVFS